MLIHLLSLLLAAQQPAISGRGQRPAAPSAIAEVRVTDRSGTPAEGAQVTAEGPSSRQAVTDADGRVTFRTMTNGTYRIRAEHEGFIALEKEVVIRAGKPAQIDFALAAAPVRLAPAPEPAPPSASPPPPSAPRVETVLPGEARVLSIPDIAEKALGGREAVNVVSIGCSGRGNAQLLRIRDSMPAESHADADEMLYVVAGEATLRLQEKDQAITSGWFSIVPRGMSHAITRRGRNPVILLSILSGDEPCPGAKTTAQR